MRRVAVGLALLVAFGAHAQEEKSDKFLWKCQDTGKNSAQCAIKNENKEPAGVCVQVVKICKDGEHIADLCSGLLRPGEVKAKVVTGYTPKVRYFESCMGYEYRDPVYLRP